MEYITSRGYSLPQTKSEMENNSWFNMWEKQNFPYKELLQGDKLFWFDTKRQEIVWETEVASVDRFPYSDKNEIFKKYKDAMGAQYYDSRPDSGYFLKYDIKVIDKVNIPKPANYKFPQLGWVRLDSIESVKWFNRTANEDVNLDKLLTNTDNISEALRELNKKMQHVSPEKIEKVMNVVLRHDCRIVKELKKASKYTCQFPSCTSKVKMKNGKNYVEVAHIHAVKQAGKSVLGNLLVLCPNHHKEFDHGHRVITKQTENNVSGKLNSTPFDIKLIY